MSKKLYIGESALNKLRVTGGNVEAYSILIGDSIKLGSVDSQGKIQLPDVLYTPSSPTT